MAEPVFFSGPPVCVVGNINRDVKLLGVPASPALLQDGETSVPGVIETVGGGGANSACAAAALGARVRFVGKIGADDLGERLRQTMERHGVNPRLVRDPACVTGTSVALGFSTGHRHFLSSLPNNESLRFEDLDVTVLDGCGHLLRADVWFSQAMLEGGNRRLFAEARQRGLATSLDINFDPRWSTGASAEIAHRKHLLQGVLDQVDVAHGNVRELCEFSNSPSLETALKRLSDWGVKAVVVHMGTQGAGYYSGGQLIVEPARLAERVVNSTGTGDLLSMCMILLHARKDLSVQQKLALSNNAVHEFIEGKRTMIPTLAP
jgi:sugar/nucleoside kinase (ribokinase family)